MNLKQLRRSRKDEPNQEQVADKLGMTRGRFTQLELNPKELKVKTILNLSSIYKTSPVTIFKIILRMIKESEVTK